MRNSRIRGFSLVEMAIVIVIITLLLGAVLVPLGTQVGQRKTDSTQNTLNNIKDAIIGFAVAKGRLPCPASATSNGAEDPAGGGICNAPFDGFVPAATLGITPTDAQGYAIDAWGNRIHYAVTRSDSNAFTTSNGMRNKGMSLLSPDLAVCASSVGITSTNCGSANTLSSNAVAVIFSVGSNGADVSGYGPDELANYNPPNSGDAVFIDHISSQLNSSSGQFDDLVTWISPYVLYNRMISAGQLP
jgi:prepilin-type N-terminal cleavage/methylation domain-containing protein